MIDRDLRVEVISLVNHPVGITVPELKIKRRWDRKGTKRVFTFDQLSQLIYEPGVEYLFKEGMLDILNNEVKNELGLPVDMVKLTDEDMTLMLSNTMLMKTFQEKLSHLTKEQINELVDFGIKNKIVDINKSEVLEKITGRSILKTVQIEKLNEEE